jgi:hypothetical protein
MEDYLSIREMATKWDISVRRIQVLCREGRIKGATLIGNMWLIPSNASKPSDARIKSGRYIKKD